MSLKRLVAHEKEHHLLQKEGKQKREDNFGQTVLDKAQQVRLPEGVRPNVRREAVTGMVWREPRDFGNSTLYLT